MNRRCICHKHGIEYISMEKAACTSIKAALLQADGIDPPDKLWDVHHHPHWREPAPVQWTFSFVRHPLIRPFSLWWDMVRTGRSREFRASLSPEISFAAFIRWIAIQEGVPNRHYAPQALILDASLKGGTLDFVGHLETIGNDWATVQAHAPGIGSLLRRNVSTRPKDWRAFYDDETLAIARRYYAADFYRWPRYE